MKFFSIFLLSAFVLVSCGGNTQEPVENTQTPPKEEPMDETAQMDHSDDMDMDEDMIKKSLSDSPRHQEWVEVDNNGKTIYTFVVYPENKEKAPALMMIHENKGLTDWVRSMADEVAAEGYIVVAPDLLSNVSEDKTRTSDFETPDEATQALYGLDPEQVKSDMLAVTEYAKGLEAGNGSIVTAGFCWGGSRSFEMATISDDISASLVFYGTAPEDASVYADIDVPVFGFYGGDDERVNSTLEQTEQYMTQNDKMFEYDIYDGAGHAFMRTGEAEDGEMANKEARGAAFEKMMEVLAQYK